MDDFFANEVAIIFEPLVSEDNFFEFCPVTVIEGYYNEDDERFVDVNLYTYSHILDCSDGKSYAYRKDITELLSGNPDKSLNEIKDELLEEANKYKYTIGTVKGEIVIMQQNIETEKYSLLLDRETHDNLMCLIEDNYDFEQIFSDEVKEEAATDISVSDNVDNKIPSPHQLYEEIRKVVKGQDDAIKRIVTTIWENQMSDYSNNMIILGPSGVGKTEILRQISNKLNIPLYITSVSGMSQAGYKGTGTDEILSNLFALTKGNKEQTENAIVVLDEFDKIAYRGSESGSVSTDGVQNELLKIVEDGTFGVEYSDGLRRIKEMINTKNITFIGIGAFSGILKTETEKHLGFGNDIVSKTIEKDKILPEDLIKFGIKPELVGRMGKIVKLNSLTLDNMKDIIKNSNNSSYISKINLLKRLGISLNENKLDSVVDAIAKEAISKNIGARAINNIVNEMFSDILFEVSGTDVNYSELEISGDIVTDSKKYILRK